MYIHTYESGMEKELSAAAVNDSAKGIIIPTRKRDLFKTYSTTNDLQGGVES